MTSPVRVMLIAVGCYNPVTNMHLRMFEIARDTLNRTEQYRVVGGIVSPAHDSYIKQYKKDSVSAKHRCAMVRHALKSSDWIKLDTWETEQDTWFETLKVLRHHKQVLDSNYNSNRPDSPTKRRKLENQDSVNYAYLPCNDLNANEGPVQLKLLCGADLIESFLVPGLWKEDDIHEICSKFGIVCISRCGSNPEKVIYESDILSKYQKNILLVTEWIQNEISSTKIRRSLKRGESVKYLLQDSVIDYIKAHNLYGAADNKILNYMTPSPNREDADPDLPPDMAFLSPRVAYKTIHNTYVSQSLDSDAAYRRGYRRHRDLNYDEEHRKGRKGSSDYRRDSSFDSLDSDHSYNISNRSPRSHSPHTPHQVQSPNSPTNNRPVTCMGADITGLVRRVRGMKVTMTPETCV